MNRVIPRFPTYLITWIVMFLLLDFVLTKDHRYSGENSSCLNFQEENPAYYNFQRYWQNEPFHKSNLTEIISSRLSNTNPCLKNNQVAESTRAKECTIRKTLVDYNNPAIMEDPDSKNDQDFTNHVRVKRNEPIVSRNRSTDSLDSLPRNFCSNAINVFGNFNSVSVEPYADLNRRNRPVLHVTTASSPHLRRKREISSKNGKCTKRVKGNIRHPRHRVGTRVKNKKHGTFKSSRHHHRHRRLPPIFPLAESGNNTLDIDIGRINAANEKVEMNPSLTNNRSFDEQRGDITVALPFVHIGKAELRVRIEKLPKNESSFLNSNNWTDRSAGKTSYLLAPKNGIIGKIFDVDVTNLKLISNCNSSETKEANNFTIKSRLKKVNCRYNVSSQERNNFESTTFYNAASHSVDFALQKIKDNGSLGNERLEDHTKRISSELIDDDAKSRAKRNQEIIAKQHQSNGINMIGSKYLKNAAQKSIRSIKHEKTRYRKARGDRAVRSIEEIKQLAKKLIVKVNELQVYVSNHNETLYTTDSCIGENADDVEQVPRMSVEKQGISTFKSKIATSTNGRRHSHDQEAMLIGQRASQRSPNASRFARREHRTRRRSHRKWGRWMDWSSCSVTCGKGRQIRWRHCLRDCYDAETEMEEKACQLPACPPGKFLGIF